MPGAIKEIRGVGMPVYTRVHQMGNLYITFNIKFPSKMSSKHLKALRECLPKGLSEPSSEGRTTVFLYFDCLCVGFSGFVWVSAVSYLFLWCVHGQIAEYSSVIVFPLGLLPYYKGQKKKKEGLMTW